MALSKEAIQFEQIASWHQKEYKPNVADPLRDCLLMMGKYFEITLSAKALVSGLPLENNRLTVDLVQRAANRLRCDVKIENKTLNKINPLTYPCILILKNNNACLLIGKQNEIFQIVMPGSAESISEINETSLAENYAGTVIFMKPQYHLKDHSLEVLPSKDKKHWFWEAMQTQWSSYTEVFIASFLINLFALATPLFVMNVYDRVVPNHAIETLWVLAIGTAIVFIFDFTFKTLRAYFIDLSGKKIDLQISTQVFEKILSLRMEAKPKSVGALANSVSAFESFREFITSATITVLIDMPFAILFIAIIAWIGGWLAIVPLIAIPLMIMIGLVLQLPLVSLTKKSYQFSAEKQATLFETISGLENIKGLTAEGTLQKRWEQTILIMARINNQLRIFSNLAINSSLFMAQFVTVAIVILGVYQISNGNMTTGGLIACTMIVGRVMAPLTQFASLMTRYYQSMNSLDSVDRIMSLPSERNPDHSPLHRPKLKGNIRFKNVSFQYPGELHPNLHDINFKISEGEKIAIIGRIGSGKTTIAKLLMGFYQPTSGSILVDETQISQIDQSDLRHNIGYVPQDIVLFCGSVKDNICLGASYVDDNAILNAATSSTAARFITQHPLGFDLPIVEKGSNLSGGQRQTIALARALLLNPDILLFDEPSNAMDDSTEIAVKKALEKIIQDKTTIIVTHKASMLSLVDRVIVLEGGRIVADGPKEAVIQALSQGKLKKQD